MQIISTEDNSVIIQLSAVDSFDSVKELCKVNKWLNKWK